MRTEVQRSVLMARQYQALAPRVALPCQGTTDKASIQRIPRKRTDQLRVIKPPLRHFKRPAYASSSYAPSVPKKTDEHPVRYKMLDQRIKMKKIQNISHNWNRK
ncbi:Calcium/Calmodulin-Dependent 3',5'-Cyclic Nucleotide Phosphodiesterase 1C [Manis pentadactyla]|nr:Calcium/Calmodulin-Dependent 3',5'-Cyclic Nucleotide Phosphodiesterase 1C [Manis pentadactyla]